MNNDSKFNSNFPETFTVNGRRISDKNKLKELTVKKIKGIWPWSGDTLPYYTLPHNEEFIYILKPLVTLVLKLYHTTIYLKYRISRYQLDLKTMMTKDGILLEKGFMSLSIFTKQSLKTITDIHQWIYTKSK